MEFEAQSLIHQFSSVAQSCPTLHDPMDHSMPGLPVHHQLPEFTQTHLHWVSDAIQPSHPLSSPSPPAFKIFPSIRVFSNESAVCVRWPKYWSFSFNISPSSEHSGLISFRMGWLDLLAVQGTLKSRTKKAIHWPTDREEWGYLANISWRIMAPAGNRKNPLHSAAKWQANKHEVFFLFGNRTQDMKYVLGREFHIALEGQMDLYWGSKCLLWAQVWMMGFGPDDIRCTVGRRVCWGHCNPLLCGWACVTIAVGGYAATFCSNLQVMDS